METKDPQDEKAKDLYRKLSPQDRQKAREIIKPLEEAKVVPPTKHLYDQVDQEVAGKGRPAETGTDVQSEGRFPTQSSQELAKQSSSRYPKLSPEDYKRQMRNLKQYQEANSALPAVADPTGTPASSSDSTESKLLSMKAASPLVQ